MTMRTNHPGTTPHLRLVPTELEVIPTTRRRRRSDEPLDDAQRIEAARELARSTAIGRELLDRMDADGVQVELVPDQEFAVRYGRTRAARRVELTSSQAEDGVQHLVRKTVIAVPWTTMLRPKEGALALIHQGAHHMLDHMASPEVPMSASEREEKANALRTLADRELRSRLLRPRSQASIEQALRTYRDGADRP
jgi:hypothetical protein